MKPQWILAVSLLLPALTLFAAEPLEKRLVSDDASVRQAAVSQFKQLAPDQQEVYTPDLMIALNDDDPGVRADASGLLKAMGVAARASAPEMKRAAAQEQNTVRQDVIHQNSPEVLRVEKDRQVDLMRKALAEEKRAQVALPEARDESSPVTALLQALKDPDPLTRSHAARQLGAMHPAPLQAIPELTNLLEAQDAETRGAAAAALGAMGSAAHPALEALLRDLADPDPSNRQIVGEAIKQIQLPSQ